MKIKIICIDLQKDFSQKRGKHFRPHLNVDFIKNEVIPFLRENKIKVAEIISDYRLPRPGDPDDSCNPGKTGYESELPDDVKDNNIWIKCMNSPIWTRENIGEINKKPGVPYQNPELFTQWLNEIVGKPEEVDMVILMGLTADCCVFCTAQELCFRAYKVKILSEGVDVYSGDQKEKEQILNNYPLSNWAEPISWEELKKILK